MESAENMTLDDAPRALPVNFVAAAMRADASQPLEGTKAAGW
jgi:hypothetical protein